MINNYIKLLNGFVKLNYLLYSIIYNKLIYKIKIYILLKKNYKLISKKTKYIYLTKDFFFKFKNFFFFFSGLCLYKNNIYTILECYNFLYFNSILLLLINDFIKCV